MIQQRNESEALDRTLTALADPTRREILERLSNGEARVTELAARFPISLNSVSKHIRMLERAALVERRVVGRNHFLHIRSEPLEALQHWITQKRAFWQMQLQALDEELTGEVEQGPRRHHG